MLPRRPRLRTALAWGGTVRSDINIHIDDNMNIDIHIIINMNRQCWYPQALLAASSRDFLFFLFARHAFLKRGPLLL